MKQKVCGIKRPKGKEREMLKKPKYRKLITAGVVMMITVSSMFMMSCQSNGEEAGGKAGGSKGSGVEIGDMPAELKNQKAIPIGEVEKNKPFEKTTKVEDVNGDVFYVPGGFGISYESSDIIGEGIIVLNEEEDKEFVWIPVDDESIKEMYVEAPGTQLDGSGREDVGTAEVDVYSNLRYNKADDTEENQFEVGKPGEYGKLVEPELSLGYDLQPYTCQKLGAEDMQEYAKDLIQEYEDVYASTCIYNGFYIGRYELTGTYEKPTVAREQELLVLRDWYDLKQACINLVDTEYAGTTMIYGNQWDEVMSWIVETGEKTYEQVYEDSFGWGNYINSETDPFAYIDQDKPNKSASNLAWQANEIYDLAGNAMEWTQECINGFRVMRGGNYMCGSKVHANSRELTAPDWATGDDTTRAIMYVKW